MENVDCFELYAGRVLGMLYEKFPLPRELTVDLILAGTPEDSLDETTRRQIAGHTTIWLTRAGYIERATEDSTGPFRGTLTAKGFECLRALPNSLLAKPAASEGPLSTPGASRDRKSVV